MKLSPPSNFSRWRAAIQSLQNFSFIWGGIRWEQVARKVVFGTTFKPANKAIPSSKTKSITWLLRSVLESFSASSDSQACGAGIIAGRSGASAGGLIF